MQRISPVECAMMFGVAVVVTSLTVSALAAIVVDTAYQAIAERRWLPSCHLWPSLWPLWLRWSAHLSAQHWAEAAKALAWLL